MAQSPWVDLPPVTGVALTHYLGVNGSDQFEFDGLLYVNSKVKDGDILDGVSHTIMVGERPPSYDFNTGWWFADSGPRPWFGAAGVVLGTEERIAVRSTDMSDFKESIASTPDAPKSQFQPGNHDFEDDGSGWDKHGWHFWSWHQGGAYFVFADGHVSFIPFTVSADVFRSFGTRGGQENDHGEY